MNSPKIFEVELKFRIPDAADMTLRLLALGAQRGCVMRQYDLYLRHPSRDFEKTHEAFRLRRSNEDLFLTYKGPIIDTQTKMRHEIEVPVGRTPEDFDRLRVLFEMLGFQAVRPVEKVRAEFHFNWDGRDLELAVDAVDKLGDFLEIESLAVENERDAARDAILRLAECLGLTNPERRSYLSLLLEQDAPQMRPTKSDAELRG